MDVGTERQDAREILSLENCLRCHISLGYDARHYLLSAAHWYADVETEQKLTSIATHNYCTAAVGLPFPQPD